MQPDLKDDEEDDEEKWTGSLNQMTKIMKQQRKKLESRMQVNTD